MSFFKINIERFRPKNVLQPRGKSLSMTVGLPRSGTNYFQNLLVGLTGQTAGSIYVSRFYSNLKSHAISRDFLNRELFIFQRTLVPNYPIYLLLRDPRDIVISFYEFFKSRKQGDVSQKQFLDIDWFLAFSRGTARVDLRDTHLFPLSIKEAMIEFADNWLAQDERLIRDTDPKDNVYIVRYEDLTTPENVAFVFHRLGIIEGSMVGHEIDRLRNAMAIRVSQYGGPVNRPRACPYGFRNDKIFREYLVLIKRVEQELSYVLGRFGYVR